MDSVGLGGFFRDEICKTNKGKYIILKDKNPDFKIAYSKVILDNIEYKITIPQQEYYIVYYKILNETQRVFPDSSDIKFYNINNEDITNEILKILFQ